MKKVIIYNKQNGERFEYALPFQYLGVTYCIDIFGTVIAIEQEFSSGEWQRQEVYALSSEQELFEVTIIE